MISLLTRKTLHICMTTLSMAIQWLELLLLLWELRASKRAIVTSASTRAPRACMISLLTRKILHIGMTAFRVAIQWLELLLLLWELRASKRATVFTWCFVSHM